MCTQCNLIFSSQQQGRCGHVTSDVCVSVGRGVIDIVGRQYVIGDGVTK